MKDAKRVIKLAKNYKLTKKDGEAYHVLKLDEIKTKVLLKKDKKGNLFFIFSNEILKE